MSASTLVRYLDLGIAARRRRVHGRDNPVNMAVNGRSLRIAKNDNGKTPALQILPIADVFIRGHRDSLNHGMVFQRASDTARRAVVKENEHRRALTPANEPEVAPLNFQRQNEEGR